MTAAARRTDGPQDRSVCRASPPLPRAARTLGFVSTRPMPTSLLALKRDWYRTSARLRALTATLPEEPEEPEDCPPTVAAVLRAGRERQARLWTAVWAHPYWATAPLRERAAERVALRRVGQGA